MIRMKGAGDPVWGVPYFGNLAAMALLAANEARPNPPDVRRAERWLSWYAKNQEADGAIFDREGTVAAYKSNGRRDATDSYAATFLLAVWRFRQATGTAPQPAITEAARKSLAAIEAVVQPDGLTIAKPDYPMKYLMDNIEVHGGLREAALFFHSAGLEIEAGKADRLAARLAGSLPGFWSEKDQCFAVALDGKGVFTSGLRKSYPDGLAQLFALAHVPPVRPALWRKMRQSFKPGDEGVPVERWLMAATRCAGPKEIDALRQATRKAMLEFTVNAVYVERPALAILALLDGKARLPDVRAVIGK